MLENVTIVSVVVACLALTAPCRAAAPPAVDSITVLAVAALAETYCPESHGIYGRTKEALESAGLLPEQPKQGDADTSAKTVPGLDARVRALTVEVDGMGHKVFCDMMRRKSP